MGQLTIPLLTQEENRVRLEPAVRLAQLVEHCASVTAVKGSSPPPAHLFLLGFSIGGSGKRQNAWDRS